MHRIAEMVAGIRLDEVEHKMQTKPEEYPEYTDAIEAERILTKALLEKYGLDKVELDQLVGAVNASGAALAVEMYIAGFLDGGMWRTHSREEKCRMTAKMSPPLSELSLCCLSNISAVWYTILVEREKSLPIQQQHERQ